MSKRPSGALNAQRKKLLKERFSYQLVRVTEEFDVEELSPAALGMFEKRFPAIAARWIDGGNAPISWQTQCAQVLKSLMSGKAAAPFLAPVDPVQLNLPDYFQVIKQPMDLGTVSRQLNNGLYHSADEFRRDVHLTFDNAMKFNPPGNLVHEDARKLKSTFDRKFAAIQVLQSKPAADEWPDEAPSVPREAPKVEAAPAAEPADEMGEEASEVHENSEISVATDPEAAAMQSEMEAFAMDIEPEETLKPVLSDDDSDIDSDKDEDTVAAPAAAESEIGAVCPGARQCGRAEGTAPETDGDGGRAVDGAQGVSAAVNGRATPPEAVEAADKHPSSGGKQPSNGGKRPAIGGKQPAVGGKQPAVGGKQPASGGKGAPSADDEDDCSIAGDSEIADSEMDASENASEAGDGDQVSESELFDDDDDEADYADGDDADGDDIASELQSEMEDGAESTMGDDAEAGSTAGDEFEEAASYPGSEEGGSEAGNEDDMFEDAS